MNTHDIQSLEDTKFTGMSTLSHENPAFSGLHQSLMNSFNEIYKKVEN